MDGLELKFIDGIKTILLLSFGGILGSNLRLFIFQKLGKIFIRNNYKIFFINNLASFFLGFFSANFANNSSAEYSYNLLLLIVIGFVGGLSTFSTFMYDLFELSLNNEFSQLMKIFFLSVIFGLTFFYLGFLLGC